MSSVNGAMYAGPFLFLMVERDLHTGAPCGGELPVWAWGTHVEKTAVVRKAAGGRGGWGVL